MCALRRMAGQINDEHIFTVCYQRGERRERESRIAGCDYPAEIRPVLQSLKVELKSSDTVSLL